MTRTCLLLAAALLSGCMLLDNIGPSQRFSDQVQDVNEQARWGRLDLAVMSVAPEHRSAFMRQHESWTEDVRVADVDVTNLEMHLPDGSMAATVKYSWVDERTMELHETTVRQRWISAGEGFALAGEMIIAGEPELLEGAPVREDEPDGSGDDTGDEGWEEVAVETVDETETEVATAEVATAEVASADAATPAPTRTHHRDAQGQLIAD